MAATHSQPWFGVCILIVDFQANIVFAIYRAFFEPNIAHISRPELNIAIYRDIQHPLTSGESGSVF